MSRLPKSKRRSHSTDKHTKERLAEHFKEASYGIGAHAFLSFLLISLNFMAGGKAKIEAEDGSAYIQPAEHTHAPT